MKMFEKIILLVVNIEIKFLALQTNFQTCNENCKNFNGYLPYVSEVKDKNLVIKSFISVTGKWYAAYRMSFLICQLNVGPTLYVVTYY